MMKTGTTGKKRYHTAGSKNMGGALFSLCGLFYDSVSYTVLNNKIEDE
jgi:hypothetical protein